MKYSILFFAGSVFLYHILEAQLINEQNFPPLPYKGISSSINGTAGTGFSISGISSMDWYSPFDLWGTIAQPYFILSAHQQRKKVILLPQTENSVSFGLGGNGNKIFSSSVVNSKDSLFILWSNIKEYYGDVAPNIVYDAPYVRLAKYERDSLRTVASFSNGLHPSLVTDEKDILHFVWENVTPLDSQWSSHFSKYTSTVVYQNRTAQGEFSLPSQIGNGFFPSVKVKNDIAHVLFFGADSSNQQVVRLSYRKKIGNVFSKTILLQNFTFGPYSHFDISYRMRYFTWQWYADAKENIHIVWRDRYGSKQKYILHYSETDGIQIDSLNDVTAHFRFLENGNVKVFSVVPSGGNDSSLLQTYISKQGSPFQKIRTQLFFHTLSLNQILKDVDGYEHALLTEGKTTFLFKYADSDSAKLLFLSSEYSINPSSFVDAKNNVWLTGKRDSTHVILNFPLHEVGRFQDFSFPLRVGNEWYYELCGDTDPVCIKPRNAIVKAVKDTVMPNSKIYIELSTGGQNIFLRKDGLKVYQYSKKDSSEFTRFDFTKSEGDTVDSGRKIIVMSKSNDGKKISFRGSGDYNIENLFNDGITIVTDSLGITSSSGIGDVWKLIGAKINGKNYGRVLSVNEKPQQLPSAFSLSQNYPNPFNPATVISYQLPVSNHVSLKVYDVLGREVVTLVNEKKEAGNYSTSFDATTIPSGVSSKGGYASGVYFYQLRAGTFVETKKMLLLK